MIGRLPTRFLVRNERLDMWKFFLNVLCIVKVFLLLSIWNGCRNSLQAIAISTKLITYVSSFRNQWQATIWSFFSNAIKLGKWSFLVIWWWRYVTVIDSIAVSPTCYLKSEFAYFQNNVKQHTRTFHVVVALRI